MKPLIEFSLACVLLLVGGCSAIAGMFTANLWTAIFSVGAIAGVVLMLTHGTRSKQ
jgi:hypothetical protein